MASAGQKIRNPVTGENITFLETAADTNGRILRLEMVTDPRSGGAAEHLHPRSTERFDVRDGKLQVWLGDDEHLLGQGTKLEIPPRTRHRFATPDDQPARVLCEFEPAGRFEYFMETVYRLAGRADLAAIEFDRLTTFVELMCDASVARFKFGSRRTRPRRRMPSDVSSLVGSLLLST
jgi:mannose-6-phosphate isomerase-like protein (cupin superfamily)